MCFISHTLSTFIGFVCNLAVSALSDTSNQADANACVLHLHVYSRAEWLDVIEVSFNHIRRGNVMAPVGGCIAVVMQGRSR